MWHAYGVTQCLLSWLLQMCPAVVSVGVARAFACVVWCRVPASELLVTDVCILLMLTESSMWTSRAPWTWGKVRSEKSSSAELSRRCVMVSSQDVCSILTSAIKLKAEKSNETTATLQNIRVSCVVLISVVLARTVTRTLAGRALWTWVKV